MGAFTSAIISFATAATAVGSAIQAFKGPKSSGGGSAPAVQPLPQQPTVDSAAADAEKRVAKKRAGIARNKTIRTNPLGLSQEEKSDVATKRLLGS